MTSALLKDARITRGSSVSKTRFREDVKGGRLQTHTDVLNKAIRSVYESWEAWGRLRRLYEH